MSQAEPGSLVMSVDYTHFVSGKAPTPSVRAVMSYQEKWLKREYNDFNMCIINTGTFFFYNYRCLEKGAFGLLSSLSFLPLQRGF